MESPTQVESDQPQRPWEHPSLKKPPSHALCSDTEDVSLGSGMAWNPLLAAGRSEHGPVSHLCPFLEQHLGSCCAQSQCRLEWGPRIGVLTSIIAPSLALAFQESFGFPGQLSFSSKHKFVLSTFFQRKPTAQFYGEQRGPA